MKFRYMGILVFICLASVNASAFDFLSLVDNMTSSSRAPATPENYSASESKETTTLADDPNEYQKPRTVADLPEELKGCTLSDRCSYLDDENESAGDLADYCIKVDAAREEFLKSNGSSGRSNTSN